MGETTYLNWYGMKTTYCEVISFL